MADEYAELLYDSCASGGFMNQGFASKILMYTLQYPETDQLFLFLASANQSGAGKILQKYTENRTANPESGSKSPGELSAGERYNILNSWFRDSVRERLLSYFTPVSVSYMEEQYHKFRQITKEDLEAAQNSLQLHAGNSRLKDKGNGIPRDDLAKLNRNDFQQNQFNKIVMSGSADGFREVVDEQTRKQILSLRKSNVANPGKVPDKTTDGQPEEKMENPPVLPGQNSEKANAETPESSNQLQGKSRQSAVGTDNPHTNSPDKSQKQYCFIWELPTFCEDPEVSRHILRQKTEELKAFEKICPASLYSSLARLRNILQEDLTLQNQTDLSQKIQLAENTFFSDLKKAIQIENYMAEAEAGLIPASIRFYQTLQSV